MAWTTRSICMKREPLTSTLPALRQLRQHGRVERVDVVEMAGSRARALEGGDAVRRFAAEREHGLDAALARPGADLGMELRPLVADLAHVAEHQQARARQAASTSIAARIESGLAL